MEIRQRTPAISVTGEDSAALALRLALATGVSGVDCMDGVGAIVGNATLLGEKKSPDFLVSFMIFRRY